MGDEHVPDSEYVCRARIHQIGVVFVVNYKQAFDRCAAQRCGRVPQPGGFLLDDTINKFLVTDHRGADAGLELAIPVQVHRPDRATRGSFLSEIDGLHVHLRVVGKDFDVTEMTFADQPSRRQP